MVKRYSITASSYEGLDMTSSPEDLAPPMDRPRPCPLVVCQNVRHRKGGGCTRLGIEHKGTVGTGDKINSIHTYEALGVMFCKSGTEIRQSLDGITWYSIGVTRTESERDFFLSHEKEVYEIVTGDTKPSGVKTILATVLSAPLWWAVLAVILEG